MKPLAHIGLGTLFLMQLSAMSHAQAGIITTYTGRGMPQSGTQAITQPIDWPSSIAPDGSGGFYVASRAQNRIYRVTADGKLSLAAGSGIYGFAGDGGPATAAQLAAPQGIAVDTAGNLYIADLGNSRVRKVTPEGTINTAAGTAAPGFSGDGGPARLAQLHNPWMVATDSAGNLYIADSGNNRIRKVTSEGKIGTVAGNGLRGYSGDGGQATAARLSIPRSIAVDAAGNLYIADSQNDRIRRVTTEGKIITVAGNGKPGFRGDGGQATAAQLLYPSSIAIDASGNLFIVEGSIACIRKVTAAGVITTFAGNGRVGFSGDGGPASSAQLNIPSAVALDADGNLYIAEQIGGRVRKVTPDGIIHTVAGCGTSGFSGDGGTAMNAQLNSPRGVTVDRVGNLFISDEGNHRIRKVTPAGTIVTVAGNGMPGFLGDGGPAASARLNTPMDIALDAAGNLYIADSRNNRIRKVSQDGVISSAAGNGTPSFGGDGGQAIIAQLNDPHGVTLDAAGNLYIADTNNNRIRKVASDGLISTIAGTGTAGFDGDGGPAAAAQLNQPSSVAVDGKGNLYISDSRNDCIRKVMPAGTITTMAASQSAGSRDSGVRTAIGPMISPLGLALDSAGNLYISASTIGLVCRVSTEGSIGTVAGIDPLSGFETAGFSGDGGPAASAQLNAPSGVAVDAAGNLYIADTWNHRVRRVSVLGSAGAYESSLDGLRRKAEQGDVLAQYILGRNYRYGPLLPRDDGEAVRWYLKAAEQGLPDAQACVAMLYARGGIGVALDHTEAAKWFRKAAEQGVAGAQAALGIIYANGDGVERDPAEAARWLRRAAEQGEPEAQANLGLAYFRGEGVSQDYTEAYMWLDIVATRGTGEIKSMCSDIREKIAAGMTAAQIAEAKKRAQEWLAAFER